MSRREAHTLISFFYRDMDLEAGAAIDWACGRAAAEGISLGAYVGQVLRMYREDLTAQEARERTLAVQRRKAARIQASGVAGNPAEAVGALSYELLDRRRSDD